MGYIYKLQSKYNSKLYIGLTKNTWEYRVNTHITALKSNLHTNIILQNHYNKYKHLYDDLFEVSMIEECEDEKLCEREIYWIDFYKSYDRDYGFNRTYGGEQNIPTFDTILRKRLSANNKPISAYNLDGTFYKTYYSISEAARELNITDSDIIRCTKYTSQRQRGNYMFSRDEKESIESYSKRTASNIKFCYVFDKQGILLSEHKSIAIAARHYNVKTTFATTYSRNGSLVENRIYFSTDIHFKPKLHKKAKFVNIYTLEGIYIETIGGLKACSNKYGLSLKNLHQKIKNKRIYNNYYFTYESTFNYQD